jgi:arylsulfatase A-like enzyme
VGGYVPEGPHRQGWQEWHGYETGHRFFDVWRFDEQQREVRVEGYDWEPTWHTDMMLDFAARQRETGRPWLYYLSFGPPHRPEECPQEYLDRFPPGAFRLPPDLDGRLSADDGAELRRIWQVYYGQVAAVDHEVGRLVAGLEQLGVAENTIILYVGDHGDRLGSHWKAVGGRESNPRGKAVPYATAFRIPLIVRWPAGIEAGQLCDALMPCVDLTPTLLDLAGLRAPEAMQGSSMADWCRRGTGPRREILYLGLGGGPHAWRAVWDGRHLFARGRYRHLYDHREDPHEMNDLLGAPSHRALARELDARLLELARATGDPYVEGLEREGPLAL